MRVVVSTVQLLPFYLMYKMATDACLMWFFMCNVDNGKTEVYFNLHVLSQASDLMILTPRNY